MNRVNFFPAILGVIAFAGPSNAHHSDAIYDREVTVAGEGVVTRYTYRNPHVLIGVELANNDGEIVEWLVETGSTPIMNRSGWSADMLSPGDRINVRLHPERTGNLHGILHSLETSEGEVFMQIEDAAVETVPAESLEGVWRGARQPGAFQRMRSMAITPAAEAGRAAYAENGPDPSRECDPATAPFNIASGLYLTGIELLDDRVIVRNEFLDVYREVWTDGREHPADGEYTLQGHSIGWWEDDTLVVDTRYFEENPSGNGRGGTPSSRQKQVVERYSLTEDGMRAVVDYVLEDPVYLAEPFEGRTEMIYSPHLELVDYNCIPGTLG